MTKFYGLIGFSSQTTETQPGIWTPIVTEKHYVGDIMQNTVRFGQIDQIESTNEDVDSNLKFSIIMDPFLQENIANVVYVIYMDVKWKVTSFEVKYPRITINTSGVYNGQ